MAEIGIANVTKKGVVPSQEKLETLFITPSTADSNDTLDVSTVYSTINFLIAWDSTTGDVVTATESSNVITIDAAGGTTDHVYAILVIGDAAKK
jgi:hypothetical protein